MRNIAERILQFNNNRDSEKIAMKYAAMRECSFRFFRGTCHLFYEDIHEVNNLPPSPSAWLCGDLHLENAGSFKGADRLAYFDLNDFDEAILGPALWDVARLLTSVVVAKNDAGYTTAASLFLLKQLLDCYRKTLQKGKPVTIERETATGLVKELFEKVALRKEKKLVRDKCDLKTDYSTLLIDNKKTFQIDPSSKKELKNSLQTWLNEKHGRNLWKVSDIVFAVAGTGSIGVKRYLALVLKPSTQKKYLLVIKDAMPSSLQKFTPFQQPTWNNEADRICNIQYRMQHVTPGDLSTLCFKNERYVTKWLQPLADKVSLIDFIAESEKQTDLLDTFGQLTASAQLRSGGRDGSAIADELIKFGNNDDWVDPLIEFAKKYSATVKRDYKEYCRSYDKGYFNAKA